MLYWGYSAFYGEEDRSVCCFNDRSCNDITIYVKLRMITRYYCLPLLPDQRVRGRKPIQNMIVDL